MKYSIKIDFYSFQATVNEILNEMFIRSDLSKNKKNNIDFRTGKPINTDPDWTGHVTCSANHCTRIQGPKPALFVSKAIKRFIVCPRFRKGKTKISFRKIKGCMTISGTHHIVKIFDLTACKDK